jgi:hypothetical protein
MSNVRPEMERATAKREPDWQALEVTAGVQSAVGGVYSRPLQAARNHQPDRIRARDALLAGERIDGGNVPSSNRTGTCFRGRLPLSGRPRFGFFDVAIFL